jgi:hypothetical protein
LVETLMFCPAGDSGDDGSDDEPASDGFADAAHGVAASPTPTQRATAMAQIRPTYLAYPIFNLPVR